MSTVPPSSPDADPPSQDHHAEPETVAPAEAGSTARKKPPLIRRVPGAVFTTAYGALLVGVVVMGVLLASHESDAEQPAARVDRPARPVLPAETSESNVESSLRPNLIAGAETARTATGVTVTGTMSQAAEDNTAEFSGHVARLLEQNCIDNMTVRTQDNMRINFWGFCYSSLPPTTVQTYVDKALEEGAQHVSFYFHPGRMYEHSAAITWTEDSEDGAKHVMEGWEDTPLKEGLNRLTMVAYGPETVHVAYRYENDYVVDDAPTGEKFKEEYGVPTPALPRPE
ncbi:hypothetical protein [Corynebacterium sp. UBA2622]|uniref:hypothetical protein n=1 Tax=Corynebacterium sp. UBA2622 TaxID=1946393 RepID=UPI0025BF0BB9|nr:hypothetical protein [Corynebacterium sp. UBA2622]